MSNAPEHAQAGYETRDAHLKPLLQFAFWLSVGTVITLFAMYGLMRALQKIPPINDVRDPHPLAAQNDPIPLAPNLEVQRGVHTGPDYKLVDETKRQPFTVRMWSDVRADAERQLSTYAWVDKQAGIVHVPIERAMELALQNPKTFQTAPKPKD